MRAYDLRVRKWLIAGAALVLAVAVAVAVTVWLVRRSDGPATPTTAAAAVEAMCHAQGATQVSPATDPKAFGHDLNVVALRKGLIPVYWIPMGRKPQQWEAAVRPTSSGGFDVAKCKVARVTP